MATMPTTMHVTVTNAEVASQLEELADRYEQLAQLCRQQAESLRSGFQIALDITAKPAQSIPPMTADLAEDHPAYPVHNHEFNERPRADCPACPPVMDMTEGEDA